MVNFTPPRFTARETGSSAHWISRSVRSSVFLQAAKKIENWIPAVNPTQI
jgi:hypothetical protein